MLGHGHGGLYSVLLVTALVVFALASIILATVVILGLTADWTDPPQVRAARQVSPLSALLLTPIR